jgi:hypothetical protein
MAGLHYPRYPPNEEESGEAAAPSLSRAVASFAASSITRARISATASFANRSGRRGSSRSGPIVRAHDSHMPVRERALDRETIARRQNRLAPQTRPGAFTFLAPGPLDVDGRPTLLTFGAATLSIFPDKNQPYVREASWGTLLKLYEYSVRATTNMMLKAD